MNFNDACDRIDQEFKNAKDLLQGRKDDMKKSDIRGRRDEPTRLELDFWARFEELCIDDQEDPHNDIIQILRKTAADFFKEKNAQQTPE